MKFNTGIILASSILLTACGGGGGGGGDAAPASQQPEPEPTTTLPKFLTDAPAECLFTVNGEQFALSGFDKELSEVTGLNCQDASFNDLEEIELLTGLTTLSLINTGLTQVNELAALTTLTELELSKDLDLSFEGITTLTGLTKLVFSSNTLNEIPDVSALTNLETLDLSGNRFSSVENLSSLTSLKFLNVSSNKIVVVTPLANLLSLEKLDLSDNDLTDSIPALAALTNLTELQLNLNNDILCVDVVQLQNALNSAGSTSVVTPPGQCAAVIALEKGSDTTFDNALQATPYDRLLIIGDYTVEELKLTHAANSLRIELPNEDGSITFENWFINELSTIRVVEFSNGDELNSSVILNTLTLHRTLSEEDDTYIGTVNSDTIDGLGGNDTLDGNDGHDYLSGGNNTDTLVGGEGKDTLHGGPGEHDLLIGCNLEEDGTYTKDFESDTYLFNLNDGNDIIVDYDSNAGSHHGTLKFGPDIFHENISLVKDNLDLLFLINNTDDSVKVKNWYLSENNTHWSLYWVQFNNDDRILTKYYIPTFTIQGSATNTDFLGTPFDDHFIGGESDESIDGDSGDDTLLGGPGSDTITGGDNDDTLGGGIGNDTLIGSWLISEGEYATDHDHDTYLFNRGDNADTLIDYDTRANDHGTLLFGPDISAEDVALEKTGDNATLLIKGTDDKITILNWYLSDDWKINYIQFGTDAPISAADFIDSITTI